MATLDTVTRSSYGLSAPTSSPDGVRLRLRANLGSGFVDGGWWPRSGNLSTELPPLLKAMWSAGHQVYRVTYDLASWDRPPRRMTVTGRPVKVDGYRADGPMLSLVDQSGWTRIDLVVIPPSTDAQVAHRALDLAGLDGDLHRAKEILHLPAAPGRPTRMSRDGCLEPLPVGDWETDGGRVLVSSQR